MPIKKVTSLDLSIIADIHKQCFSDHYLGKFSKRLISKFYSEFLNKDGIIFIEHCSESEIDGFVLGGVSHVINAAQTFFIQNNKLRILLNIVITPANWGNTLSRVLFRFQSKRMNQDVKQNSNKDVRLLSIAVLKSCRRKGVAQQLVEEFESILRKNGYSRYGLSVHNNNNGAIKFYEKIGLVKTRKNDRSIYYSKSLNINAE